MSDGNLLSGIRVVEYSGDVPAAACAREFSRWGARVSVFEAPDSHLRSAPPTIERDGETVSLLRESLMIGKMSPTGSWRAELPDADVFVTDAPLAELNGIADEFPELVVVHSSPFGTDGPYADYLSDDLIIQALSGFAGTNGVAPQEPLAAPAAIIPRAIGILGAVAALAALLERMHSGRGEWIELSSHEACSTLIMSLRSEFLGEALPRVGGTPGWAEVMETVDGYITLSPWSRETLRNAPIAFGCDPPPDELLEGRGRFAEQEPSLAYVRPIVESLDATTIWTKLSELGSVMAMHRSARQLLEDPQLQAIDFFRSNSGLTGAGRAMRVTEVENREERPDRFALRRPPERSTGPLDGLRVVDFTHAWLGPYASGLLNDLGAEVIKVEGPKRPDLWRYEASGPMRVASPDAHPLNVRPNFNMANRGKRTISIALDTDEGRQLALDLISLADVVLENFRPRVLQNLRLTHEHMREVNPHVALVSFSGFGTGGPYDNFRANGGTTEGNAGWDLLLGYRGDKPVMLGTMQADPIVGAQMAASALAAALRAQSERSAIHVEGSMFESAVAYIDEYLLAASAGQEMPARNGNRIPGAAPHECFRCADSVDGNDEWIAISVPDDETWQRLATFAGLDRREWRTATGRKDDEVALESALSEWTRRWNALTLQYRLQAIGVPAAAVHSTLTHLRDPHLAARDWWLQLTHPDTGTRQYQGFPWRLSRRPASCSTPAPRMGEHSVEILRETLCLTDEAIDELMERGVAAGLTAKQSPDDLPPKPISPR
ncbi:MAG: CoA transferase [Chloroflexota bacterium]|nr:CoA transferase [Chloroflexota bacterium]MDE2894677.1 CoA transferase [Chloroflexota bacterium]